MTSILTDQVMLKASLCMFKWVKYGAVGHKNIT